MLSGLLGLLDFRRILGFDVFAYLIEQETGFTRFISIIASIQARDWGLQGDQARDWGLLGVNPNTADQTKDWGLLG